MRSKDSRKAHWWLIAPAIALFLFAPTFVVVRAFERWVDVPACRELCVGKGLEFRAFRTAGKQGQYCVCSEGAAEQTFRQRFTVTGGDSVLEHAFDWVVRTVAILLMIAVWVGAVYFAGSQWKKRRASAE